MKMFFGVVAALSLLAIATTSYGTTVTLNASADTWLAYTGKSSYNKTPRGDDTTINVHSGSTSTSTSTSTATTRMLGVMEFDLSQLPAGAVITDAYVQMFMDGTAGFGSSSGTGTDKARLIQLSANDITKTADNSSINPGLDWGPADIDPNTLTYVTASGTFGYSDNTSTGADTFQSNDFLSESFGYYNFATTTVNVNAYTASQGASANDLAYINGVFNDSWQKLGVMLDPQSSSTSGSAHDVHDWASSRDTNFLDDNNVPIYIGPQLVVTYTVPVPEPSSFVLLAVSIIPGMLLIARRRKQ